MAPVKVPRDQSDQHSLTYLDHTSVSSRAVDRLREHLILDECVSLEEFVRADDGEGSPAWRAWIERRRAA